MINDLIKNKRVALVGPSSFLQGKQLGTLIDSYDVVIKINLFNKLSEVDYGKKMDVLFTNFYKYIPDVSILNYDTKLIMCSHPIISKKWKVNNTKWFNQSKVVYSNIPHKYWPNLGDKLNNIILTGSWKSSGFNVLIFLIGNIHLMKKLHIFGIDLMYHSYNPNYGGKFLHHNSKVELNIIRKFFKEHNCEKIEFQDQDFLKVLLQT